MGCGTGTIRIILFICNTIVWLIGVALFATGLYLFLSGKNYEKLVDGSVFSASIIIIVVGFLIALIGFLGCFGAAKKSGGMLLLYGILLLIIITIQILGGVVSFVFSKQVSEFVKEGLELSLWPRTVEAMRHIKHSHLGWTTFRSIWSVVECTVTRITGTCQQPPTGPQSWLSQRMCRILVVKYRVLTVVRVCLQTALLRGSTQWVVLNI